MPCQIISNKMLIIFQHALAVIYWGILSKRSSHFRLWYNSHY